MTSARWLALVFALASALPACPKKSSESSESSASKDDDQGEKKKKKKSEKEDDDDDEEAKKKSKKKKEDDEEDNAEKKKTVKKNEAVIEEGATVAAKWSNGKWYIGKITAVSGDKYDVLYGDGDKAKLKASDMVAIPKDPDLEVGDHVLALWKNASMYPGVITKKIGTPPDRYTVKWDDGDTPLNVEAGKLVRH